MSKKNNFLAQAGILAVAGLLCRIIGLLYRSPLTAVIGDEGNGYYSSAYNMYAIILLISSYSIPSAVSKIISGKIALGQYKNAQKVFRCAILYVIVVGGACAVLTFLLAEIMVPANAIIVLRVFAPTIFFSGLLGAFRGFFQAQKTMVPTSISQILEQILNAAISIAAALLFISWVEDASDTTRAVFGAAGSAVGTGAGVLTGLVFMIILYLIKSPEFRKKAAASTDEKIQSYGKIYGEIFTIVTPIIMSTFVYNLSTALNQNIFQRIMMDTKEMAQNLVVTHYGIFAGKAVVISNIPIALAASMSSALIPVISGAFAKKDLAKVYEKSGQAIRVTMLIAIPSAAAFIFLAKPITALLFPQKNSLDEASLLLASIGITVVFYALSTVSNGILQAIGKVTTPLKNAILALVVQTLVLVLLLLTTHVDIYGLSIAMIVYSFLMCVFNSMSIKKYLGYRQEIKKTYIAPAFAALIMGIVSKIVYNILFHALGRNWLALGMTVVVAVLTYGLTALLFGAVDEQSLRMLPGGTRLAKILYRKK